MRSFDHITTSGLKCHIIFEFTARFLIKMRSFRARDTIFGDFVTIMSARAEQVHLILLPVADLSLEMDW